VEVSISGCGVATGFLATAQPSCSHPVATSTNGHRPRNIHQGFSLPQSQAKDSRKAMVEQSEFNEELSEQEDRLPL
jgi:hypothetical protein